MREVFELTLKWLVLAVLWALFRLGVTWDRKQRANRGQETSKAPKKAKVLPWRRA